MKIRYLQLGLAALILTLWSLPVQAQDEHIQTLERQLQERDKVILELLERVEKLERRVGIEHKATKSNEAPVAEPDEFTAAISEKVPVEGSKDMPGTVVVQGGDAERALERSLTRSGALLLPRGVLEVEPSFSYTRNEDSAPSFLESNNQVVAAETERNSDSLTADFALRLGLPWDSQLELGVPYRWRAVESVDTVGFVPTDSSSSSGAAFGDVRLGFAKTLFREGLWRPDLIGRITWNTDSGESGDNGVPLGGGFNEVRGSLTAIKRQDPLAIVGGLSYEHSFEDNQFQPGQVISANFGSFIALSPETSLRFLLLGAYQDKSELFGDEIVGSDRTLASFVVGGSTLMARGVLLNLSVEFGLTEDADDFAIFFSLPIRFSDLLY